MSECAVVTTSSYRPPVRRKTGSLFPMPTPGEVPQASSELQYVLRYFGRSCGLVTTDRERVGLRSSSMPPAATEIGMSSPSMSISQPTAEIGAQTSIIRQSTSVYNSSAVTPAIEPPISMSRDGFALSSLVHNSCLTARVVESATNMGVRNSITNDDRFRRVFHLESLPQRESAQSGATCDDGNSYYVTAPPDLESNEASLDEEQPSIALDSESCIPCIPLASDSDTGNEAVQGSRLTRIMRAFRILLRVISRQSDTSNVSHVTEAAPAAMMQVVHSSNFRNGTASAAPARGSTDNWRHSSTYGNTPTSYGSAHADTTNPSMQPPGSLRACLVFSMSRPFWWFSFNFSFDYVWNAELNNAEWFRKYKNYGRYQTATSRKIAGMPKPLVLGVRS